MIRRFVLGVLLAGLAPLVPLQAIDDRTSSVSAGDREMNAAIKNARAQLPHFWKVRAAPKNGESDFGLKVRIVDGEAVEHFWCTDIETRNGTISGAIGNDPELVKTVKLGQRIVIKEADISDWLYFKDEKMIGNYTVRALMKSMTPEERAEIKSMLGDLPKG